MILTLQRSGNCDWLSASSPKIRASGKKYLLANVQTSSEGPKSLLLSGRRAIFSRELSYRLLNLTSHLINYRD